MPIQVPIQAVVASPIQVARHVTATNSTEIQGMIQKRRHRPEKHSDSSSDADDEDEDSDGCPFLEKSSEYPSEDEEDGPDVRAVADLDRDVEMSPGGAYLISKDEFFPDRSTDENHIRTILGERFNEMRKEDVDERVKKGCCSLNS